VNFKAVCRKVCASTKGHLNHGIILQCPKRPDFPGFPEFVFVQDHFKSPKEDWHSTIDEVSIGLVKLLHQPACFRIECHQVMGCLVGESRDVAVLDEITAATGGSLLRHAK
jgi:hypothetical protein